MTLSIINRDPVPGAVGVSPRARPRFELFTTGAPVSRSSVSVRLNGRIVINGGAAVAGCDMETNGLGGFRVSLRPAEPFPEQEPATVTVSAVGEDGAALNESWAFTIADESGPRLASSTPAPGALTPSPASITLRLSDTGPAHAPDASTLSVHVGDSRVVVDGALDPAAAGWAAAVTTLASGDVEALLTPPGPWDEGRRVYVRASILDDQAVPRSSDISFFFDVGVRGPAVTSIAPVPGARGVGPGSDIEFDVTADDGVDPATLQVIVDGDDVIVDGAAPGSGAWSTSSITAVAGGYHVSLVRGADHVDGDLVSVDVRASDAAGRPMPRRAWRFQSGSGLGEHELALPAGASVVRVIAYDLVDTSFADPGPRRHTGYAWDGHWYDQGERRPDRASWHQELGDFPVAGQVMVTDSGGWRIIPPLGSEPWIDCAQAAVGWSMAGTSGQPLSDAGLGSEPVLALAAADSVIVVDFVADTARRYDGAGRVKSSKKIGERDEDQSGSLPETPYALPPGPYTRVSVDARQSPGLGRHLVMAVGASGAMALVRDLGPAAEAEFFDSRALKAPPTPVTTRSYTGSWARLRLPPAASTFLPLALGLNADGQGVVEVWDWAEMAAGSSSPRAYLDDGSVPALAAGEIRDLDIGARLGPASRLPLLVAGVDSVRVLGLNPANQAASTEAGFTASDLGLDSVPGSEISAVAMERDMRHDLGHFYASSSSHDNGAVVRFRVHSPSAPGRYLVLCSGSPFTTLSAIGGTAIGFEHFVRTSMNVVSE
jgi:hypothetical protein